MQINKQNEFYAEVVRKRIKGREGEREEKSCLFGNCPTSALLLRLLRLGRSKTSLKSSFRSESTRGIVAPLEEEEEGGCGCGCCSSSPRCRTWGILLAFPLLPSLYAGG